MNDEQIERYSRNIILKQVGGKGQEKLLASKVLIIGAGGLGAPAAYYLAAAGVGTIGLVDGDAVDLSNLQRQIIHFTKDVGIPKVESAAEKIRALNPGVKVVTYKERALSGNIREMIDGYDFVIDGTDNFPAKFLINDACVLRKKPFSHAGILRFDGQTITVLPHESPCYRCLFIAPPPAGAVPSCSQAGVLGGMAGIIGTLQAVEALKYLLGLKELLTGRLLVFDALAMRFREVRVNKNPDCPVCGKNPTITSLVDYEQKACDIRR
ncbi:MAG: molybdopterin-synthase adenylyltransferase MoeB [Deltaproteobacteria bacterium]|nr:molybdopterin-synthase adenylyltransferase MoeB [Deltaproteobacteria bacterium]